MPGRMRDRLAAARRSGFVGRVPEQQLIGSLLADHDEAAVVFVYGPGGVGKSTLLRQAHALGVEAGRTVVHLDARDTTPVAAAVLADLARAAGLPPTGDPLADLGELDGLLVLLDTAELLSPLDRWIREELLPALAADTVAVIAGREAPSAPWRTDPGWRGLVHPLRLENLGEAEARELLSGRGVPEDQHEAALRFTRGHPLALALVADVAEQGAGVADSPSPEVVTELLGALVDTVPSPRHRAALEACAQVLTTTEPLLAALVGETDAHALFAWLRGLSIIETGPRGLYPHDVARDALGSELKWRHPEAYAEVHRRAGRHYREQFYAVDPAERPRVLVEYVFLHRDSPVLGQFVAGAAGQGLDPRSLDAVRLTPDLATEAEELVARHEGQDAARILRHWVARQPEGVRLLRGPDGRVEGLLCGVQLAGLGEEDLAADAGTAAVAAHLAGRAPLAEHEHAVFFRFWMQRDGYQDLGPVQLAITMQMVAYYMASERLAYSYEYYADLDPWDVVCRYGDMQRASAADFQVGGRRYHVYTHDWRRRPPVAWLELLGEREVASVPLDVAAAAADPGEPVVALDDAAFAAAVRDALRDFGRAGALGRSPLARSALVRLGPEADDRARGDALRSAIREAAGQLEASPRDRRGFRALHHTYLQPAATQARAAELLDLPMSTYRRHLAAGVERITELLRQQEGSGG